MKKIILFICIFCTMLFFMSALKIEFSKPVIKTEISKTQTIENQDFKSKASENQVVNQELTNEQIKTIAQSIKLDVTQSDEPITPAMIVKYLLSVIGTFITSLILIFLNKKFPQWFPSPNKNMYK